MGCCTSVSSKSGSGPPKTIRKTNDTGQNHPKPMNGKQGSQGGGPGDGGVNVVKHDDISFVMIDANNLPNDPAAVAALYGSQVKGVLNTENSRIPSVRGSRR